MGDPGRGEHLQVVGWNEICLFYNSFRGNGCGTSQRQTFIAGCFAESLSEHRPSVKNSLQEKPTRCHRCILESHTSVSDILAIPTNSYWIHSVNKSKLAQWHKFKRSPDSQKTHTHTYKILVTLWIFWLSRLLYCSSLSPMATPHLEIVSWECSLEQGDSSTLMTWLGLEAVDGWKSRNIFLRRFRGWGDFNAVYRTLYNKGSKFWRTNWCSLGVLYIHLQAFVLLAKNDLNRNII